MVSDMKKYGSFIKNVLQFTIIYKLIILFCLSPILRLILKEYLKKASVSIAFNQNMIEVFIITGNHYIFDFSTDDDAFDLLQSVCDYTNHHLRTSKTILSIERDCFKKYHQFKNNS